jgi:8-oxo-dGTP diphosphatase
MSAPKVAFSTPLLSVDVIPLTVREDGTIHVLLSKRIFEPYLGELALPGVLMVAGETLREACLRALASKAGLGEEAVRFLQLAGLADSPTRDERGPTISAGYLAVVDGLAPALRESQNRLRQLDELPPVLPFDHATIIQNALRWVRRHLWDEEGRLARAMLGAQFVTGKAVRVVSQIDPAFNTTNGKRLLASKRFLVQEGRTSGRGAGRPANRWAFVARDGAQANGAIGTP